MKRRLEAVISLLKLEHFDYYNWCESALVLNWVIEYPSIEHGIDISQKHVLLLKVALVDLSHLVEHPISINHILTEGCGTP